MDAWNDYVELSGLGESKLAHPAGKGIPHTTDQIRSLGRARTSKSSRRASKNNVWRAV